MGGRDLKLATMCGGGFHAWDDSGLAGGVKS
jgi:hypothetical protein